MSSNEQQVMPRSIELYSQECVDLLQQALYSAQAHADDVLPVARRQDVVESDSSTDNESSEAPSSSSSSSESETNDEQERTSSLPTLQEEEQQTNGQSQQKQPRRKNHKKKKQETVSVGTPPTTSVVVSDAVAMDTPTALLDKHDRYDNVATCSSLLQTATALNNKKPVIVLLLKSGRFAGGVFVHGKCIVHRACQRYTVRRGQGKAQSSQDSSRGKAKSMGAQLRRAGEINLWQDVSETLSEWKTHVEDSALILVSLPKTMKKGLLEAANGLLTKRILHKIPLDVGRPTFESVVAVHQAMMQVTVKAYVAEANDVDSAAATLPENTTEKSVPDDDREAFEHEPNVVKEFAPLTPLHTAVVEGDINQLQKLVSDTSFCEDQIDVRAGPDYMTALHYAAQESFVDAVSLLLIKGGASPCIVDARNRVPYFLATHDKVREAFRRARAELGEDCWPWESSKVGPPLTLDDLTKKQEKAAEKKRRQRARQKEKKAREKREAEEMALRAKEEEEKCKREEDAKRIRDGLAPKTTKASNSCDYCQKVCKGKRRSQMLQRLDYVYCSTDCVQKHKRELMAQAALSRFG